MYMEDKRKHFLEKCQDVVEKVKIDTWNIEEAANRLVSLLLIDDDLLKYPEIQGIFGTLHEAEIPREASHAQPIGTWSKEAADRIKEEEWGRVVAAIEHAQRIISPSHPALST